MAPKKSTKSTRGTSSKAKPVPPPSASPKKTTVTQIPKKVVPRRVFPLYPSHYAKIWIADYKESDPVYSDDALAKWSSFSFKPYQHHADELFPPAAEVFGLIRFDDYPNLPTGSRFPTCAVDGKVAKCHARKGTLPGFLYTHPELQCPKSVKDTGVCIAHNFLVKTEVISSTMQLSEAHFFACWYCYCKGHTGCGIDGKRLAEVDDLSWVVAGNEEAEEEDVETEEEGKDEEKGKGKKRLDKTESESDTDSDSSKASSHLTPDPTERLGRTRKNVVGSSSEKPTSPPPKKQKTVPPSSPAAFFAGDIASGPSIPPTTQRLGRSYLDKLRGSVSSSVPPSAPDPPRFGDTPINRPESVIPALTRGSESATITPTPAARFTNKTPSIHPPQSLPRLLPSALAQTSSGPQPKPDSNPNTSDQPPESAESLRAKLYQGMIDLKFTAQRHATEIKQQAELTTLQLKEFMAGTESKIREADLALSKIKDVQTRLEAEKQTSVSLDSLVVKGREQVESLKGKVEELENELARVRSDLVSSRAESETMSTRFNQGTKVRDDALVAVSLANQEAASARRERDEAVKAKKEAIDAMEDFETEVKEVKTAEESVRTVLEKAEKDRERAEESLRVATAEIEVLRRRVGQGGGSGEVAMVSSTLAGGSNLNPPNTSS